MLPKLCTLSSVTIFLAEIGDISLDTATGSEHGYCLLLPPTVTLSAPVSTVGNAVMGSVSKLVKVGDLNNLILNLVTWNRVCNRLSGYSGYSDIRKNLSVRIAI